MSSSPVTHKKIARGVRYRLPESLRHNPCASWAIDPNVLPNTMSPRRVLPRVLITRPPSLPFPTRFLPLVGCVWSLEPVRPQAHRLHSAGRSSNLQLRDSQSAPLPN